MSNGYSKQIQKRISNAAAGTVFVSSDFADIADTETVRRNMNRIRPMNGILQRLNLSTELIRRSLGFPI